MVGVGDRWCGKGVENEAAGRVSEGLALEVCKMFPSVYYIINKKVDDL